MPEEGEGIVPGESSHETPIGNQIQALYAKLWASEGVEREGIREEIARLKSTEESQVDQIKQTIEIVGGSEKADSGESELAE